MRIFKRGAYAWWQVGMLKISLLAIGVAIGSLWAEAFLPYAGALIALGVLLGIYLFIVWVKQ